MIRRRSTETRHGSHHRLPQTHVEKQGPETGPEIFLLQSGEVGKTKKTWRQHVCVCVKMVISLYLVGGLEHLDYFSIYWECHHPN